MKRLLKLASVLFLTCLFLLACSTEDDIGYFYLTRVGIDSDHEIPQTYMVNTPGYEDKINVFYPYDTYTATEGYFETYDIESIVITEEEIVLEYNNETLYFERTSPTIAVSEDGLWYEFVDDPPQE